jgi:hypothetical protein
MFRKLLSVDFVRWLLAVGHNIYMSDEITNCMQYSMFADFKDFLLYFLEEQISWS